MKEPVRFWSKVDIGEVDECWPWLAGKSSNGYGAFCIHYKQWKAHRVVWVLTFGPIPEGLLVCHHCDNPSCCNPYHLFLGTHSDNKRDSLRKGRGGTQKLTVKDVRNIHKLFTAGERTQQELADRYNVGRSTIAVITAQINWSWLEEETDEPVV